MTVPLEHVIVLSAILFAIGVLGVALRRNVFSLLLSIQLMLAAAVLAFAGFGRLWAGREGQVDATGHVFGLLVLAAAAAELVVGLGLVVSLQRHRDTVDVDALDRLNG